MKRILIISAAMMILLYLAYDRLLSKEAHLRNALNLGTLPDSVEIHGFDRDFDGIFDIIFSIDPGDLGELLGGRNWRRTNHHEILNPLPDQPPIRTRHLYEWEDSDSDGAQCRVYVNGGQTEVYIDFMEAGR